MPVGHDADAVGDAEDLRHLGGDDDDRLALIYDTIQYAGTSTNRLVGYSNYLPNNIYHYVAGTGYNNNQPEDRICYYNDPNAGRPDAYGEQEIGFRLMCTLMKDRGLVF